MLPTAYCPLGALELTPHPVAKATTLSTRRGLWVQVWLGKPALWGGTVTVKISEKLGAEMCKKRVILGGSLAKSGPKLTRFGREKLRKSHFFCVLKGKLAVAWRFSGQYLTSSHKLPLPGMSPGGGEKGETVWKVLGNAGGLTSGRPASWARS